MKADVDMFRPFFGHGITGNEDRALVIAANGDWFEIVADVRATFTLAPSSAGCNRSGPTAEGTCSPLLDNQSRGNTPVRFLGHETMMDGAS